MAILKGPLQFTGSLGSMRSYYDKDSGKQILATKGGVNKNILKNNKSLARVRDMNREFKACSMWAKLVRNGTEDLRYLKNGRIHGKLISIAKALQKMNEEDHYGYRRIESSKFNYPLIGFSMNNAHPFKTVFQLEPDISITEDRSEVTLSMNNFISNSKFKWAERISYYRVYLTIVELQDVEWDEGHRCYFPVYLNSKLRKKTTVSDWLSINCIPLDFQITASFDQNALPREKTTVLVAMGLEFASGMQYNTPYVVKDYGTMAILRCF